MTATPLDIASLRTVLYTAVVTDVLDGLGLRNQAFGVSLPRQSGMGVLLGRAKTTLWEDVEHDERPYELELVAVDQCQRDEVIVAAASGSMRSGIWGELLSTAARNRGCAGALIDGAVRDIAAMHSMGFLVFARGTSPLDSLHRQRVIAVDVTVEIGGVSIHPGDLIIADSDGAAVIPQAVESETLAKAWEKVTAENVVRNEIRAGAKAADVFKKYGVL